jgi:hypothetical protein
VRLTSSAARPYAVKIERGIRQSILSNARRVARMKNSRPEPPAWVDPAASLLFWEKANLPGRSLHQRTSTRLDRRFAKIPCHAMPPTTHVPDCSSFPETLASITEQTVRDSSASMQSLPLWPGDALSYRRKRHLAKGVSWLSPDLWHR